MLQLAGIYVLSTDIIGECQHFSTKALLPKLWEGLNSQNTFLFENNSSMRWITTTDNLHGAIQWNETGISQVDVKFPSLNIKSDSGCKSIKKNILFFILDIEELYLSSYT